MRVRARAYPVVRAVRDGRPREDAVLVRGSGLAPLRRRAARAFHVVVEARDDVPARRAVEVRRLLLRDAVFHLRLRTPSVAIHGSAGGFSAGATYQLPLEEPAPLDEVPYESLRLLVFCHGRLRVGRGGSVARFVVCHGQELVRLLSECTVRRVFDGCMGRWAFVMFELRQGGED